MPYQSTMRRRSSWLETTPTTSTGSSPACHWCSKWLRQWPCLLTASNTFMRSSAACSVNAISKRYATGAITVVKSPREVNRVPVGRNTVRMKKWPVSSSP